ncbi:MAG: nuclear transport factor 2 family protein [Acidobacteriia bacterium]|nr:nuclear transport factor 2 family protein [Terriglobia bacterium]
MQAIALLGIITSLLAATAIAQDNQQTDTNSPPAETISKREVVEIERQGRQASRQNDVAFFERTLAQDYFGIGPSGDHVTKEKAMAERVSGKLRWETIDASEETIRVLGAAAIACGIWNVKGTLEGRDISGAIRYTRIWHKVDGKLILVHNQITSVRPPL